MKISVSELNGKYGAISVDDGDTLRAAIQAALYVDPIVEIDFEGIELFSAPFLVAAIGWLLQERTPDQIREIVVFKNVEQIGRQALERVIQNAYEYYTIPAIRRYYL